MTARTYRAGPVGGRPNNLFVLLPREHQERRVRELINARLPESLVETVTGWSVADIRRAVTAAESAA